jgi:phosphoesterase RecJ-like protein
VKVSFRGKGDVDVAKIAARYGGGGHPSAAGCTIPGSLDAVLPDVLGAARVALNGASGTSTA